MKIKIYTDGACSGNPGPGGCAAIIIDSLSNEKASIAKGYRHTTNNRMEIQAVIWGLRLARDMKDLKEVEILSDSQLVVNTMNLGWKRKSNLDLWEELDVQLSCFKKTGIRVSFTKVKGHAGNLFNEKVDRLAVNAIASEKEHWIDTAYETESGYKQKSTKRAFLVTFEVTTRVVLDNVVGDPEYDYEIYRSIAQEAFCKLPIEDLQCSDIEEDDLTEDEQKR